jgi:putative xylitol transport system permease protein
MLTNIPAGNAGSTAAKGSFATRRKAMQALIAQFGIVIAFILLCIILECLNRYFLTPGNIVNILLQTSVNGILALGAKLVILTGGIDLSVGSVLAFSAMVAASFVTGDKAYPLWVAVPAGLITGAALGLVNGLVVAYLKVPPFVATLGMLSVARGLTYAYTGGMPVPNLSEAFVNIGEGTIIGIPVPVIILAVLFGVIWWVLLNTTYGRCIYAVGGNVKSARTAGIATKAITASVYVIAGALAGLAGMVLTALTSSALPQAGLGYELNAIAAVVIGGTSLIGGVGSLAGTLLGAFIIGTINNGLDLLGVSSAYQQIVKGCIIVIAVLLDYSRNAAE